MSEYDDISMEEREFDELLADSLTDLPPDADTVHAVTPWRKAMKRVITGYGMTAITLNFFYLQYILPAIGMVLLLLGFRALRRENRWFTACWGLSILRTVEMIVNLGLNATIWHSRIYTHPAGLAWKYGSLLIILLLTFCLWRGLRQVHIKAGFAPGAGAAGAMILWYLVLLGLALVQYNGLLIGIFVLVAYLLILRSLNRITQELDEAGYAMEAAPVRLSDRTLAGVVYGCIGVSILCGSLFFQSFPMEWERVDATGQDQDVEIREHLLSLGYPEECLNDLTAAEVAACEGALDVVRDVRSFPVKKGWEAVEETELGYHIYTEYAAEELTMTGVAVRLPGERETWKIFHHFRFTVHPGFHGTEAIQLWPTDRLDGWGNRDNITGRVLYDDRDQSFAAPYYSLRKERYTTNNWFFGASESYDLFAEFSFSNEGEQHRGYVTYQVEEMVDGYIIDSGCNYIHRYSWWEYPVKTALEKRLNSGFNRRPISIAWDALQFNPKDEDPQPF